MATSSGTAALGTMAPGFTLPTVDGSRTVALAELAAAPALLVMFLCNHCPYVRHVQDRLATLTREYQERGVAVVGICSNDAEAYPTDAPDALHRQEVEAGFAFPYLWDESQAVARAYGAVCTPDFFLFDADQALVYRGQMDDSRPGNAVPVTGRDLTAAIDAVLAGEPVPAEQHPSVGCGIKWRP